RDVMREPEDPGLQRATSPGIPDLIGDYRRQQDALQKQTGELARLRGEVLIAADREALNIVANARAEVRRIIVNARRELFGLAEQIDAITEAQNEAAAAAAGASAGAPDRPSDPAAATSSF